MVESALVNWLFVDSHQFQMEGCFRQRIIVLWQGIIKYVVAVVNMFTLTCMHMHCMIFNCLALSYGSFERACVMFNIAALQSQIAAAQPMSTDEEMKSAAKMYQVCI